MSYEEKYHEWIYQVAAIVHNKNKVDRRRKLIATAVCISEYKFKKNIKKDFFYILRFHILYVIYCTEF